MMWQDNVKFSAIEYKKVKKALTQLKKFKALVLQLSMTQ